MKNFAIFLLLPLILLSPVRAQTPTYEVAEIVPDSGTFVAAAINNLGQVAGTVTATATHAVRREPDGQFTILPESPGNSSQAFGMNENGDVSGFRTDALGFGIPGIWENGVFRQVDVPAGASIVPFVRDVNNQGVATGTYLDGSFLIHAVYWEADGTAQLLPELDGSQSFALAINESGDIAGCILLPDATSRAVLWIPDGSGGFEVVVLPDLGFPATQATDLNNSGQVVGFSALSAESGTIEAVLWEPVEEGEAAGRSMETTFYGARPLGALGANSGAFGINDLGDIVGQAQVGPSEDVATLWNKDPITGDYNLNDLNDLLPGGTPGYNDALGINRAGQIIGSSLATGNFCVGFKRSVAYVSTVQSGGCVPGVPQEPCNSIVDAIIAGANEFRIEDGSIFVDGFESGDVSAWTMGSWNGKTGAEEGPGTSEATFEGRFFLTEGSTLLLKDRLWVWAAFDHRTDGNLDLVNSELEINSDDANASWTFGENGMVNDITGNGKFRFTGQNVINIFAETSADRLRFDFPDIEVDMTDQGKVTFNASGVEGENNIDVLGIRSFTLLGADIGAEGVPDAGGVELLDGLDVLDVENGYRQFVAEFLMSGLSSVDIRQKVKVGGDYLQENGEFFSLGGDVEVFGDFLLGPNRGEDPGDALFRLDINGTHTVVGDFKVGPDTDPESENVGGRNYYKLSDGGLVVSGDYTFQGTGDRFSDLDFLPEEQGLSGKVFFTGSEIQLVTHRQDEDAFFSDVIIDIDNRMAFELQNNVTQNKTGTLTLENGIIDTNNGQFDWIILNPGFEEDLTNRNNSDRGRGVVDLGSRDSYINGELERVIEFGNAEGGVITGGYLFPVGERGNTGPPENRDVDFFRPLILQFPDDLGRSSLARVDYLEDLTFEPGDFTETVVPDTKLSVNLGLDRIGDDFWKLEFDHIPSFDPNIRVQLDELSNVFDVKSLRLVQWDCDGTNPRLAGTFPVNDPNPEGSAVVNDFIEGIPNLTQEGVAVQECQILGIMANGFLNPIGQPHLENPTRMQVIHNTPDPGELNLFIDENPVSITLDILDATPYGVLEEGERILGFENESAETRSATITANAGDNIIAVTGNQFDEDFELFIKVDARLIANDPEMVDIAVFNGHPDLTLPEVEVSSEGQSVELGSVAFGNFTDYGSVPPGLLEIPFLGFIFQADLSERKGESFIVMVTPVIVSEGGRVTENDFTVVLIDARGRKTETTMITSLDDPLAADDFGLMENYPNPFSPSTRITFNLPVQSSVRLSIHNLMGQWVSTLLEAEKTAGRHAVEWNGTNSLGNPLPGGIYLYRLEADRHSGKSFVKTNKMILMR